MSTQEKKEEMSLTLMEAIETLSHIADFESDTDVKREEEEEREGSKKSAVAKRSVQWMRPEDAGQTIALVRSTFRVVLKYLQRFFAEGKSQEATPELMERVKTIMVLVGEAAKKLDRLTILFKQTQIASITDLKEYRQLQEFYHKHIAKQVDEESLSDWVLSLAHKHGHKSEIMLIGRDREQMKHLFIDLDSVKRDSEYELFFLRKEDGSRFFSPRLIRNIKLVSDFEGVVGQEKREIPLFTLEGLYEKEALAHAKAIVHDAKEFLNRFFLISSHTTDMELVVLIDYALIALLMAANPVHLSHHLPLKNCADYFRDYQFFLRRALYSADYRKIIAREVDKRSKVECCIVKLLHTLAAYYYTRLGNSEGLGEFVRGVIHQAYAGISKEHADAINHSKTMGGEIAGEYAAMAKLMKQHPNGPLNKILTDLEEGVYRSFDPLLQENLPSLLYSLYIQDMKTLVARWPSPTVQETIHRAVVNEEFKAFLRACGHEQVVDRCLLFQFQDRLTWREHSRSKVLEELAADPVYGQHLKMVTLARDTEFVQQENPYNRENSADLFIHMFKQQLGDPACGYLIPDKVWAELRKGFIDEAMQAVHRLFFSNKNVLSREQRIDFIEIFHLLLELKLIDLFKPDLVAFSCKDGLDLSLSSAAALFVFVKLLSQEKLSENDRECIEQMLYGQCLVTRERIMMRERFERLLGTIKAIESVKEEYGHASFIKLVQEAFGRLYQGPIFKAKCLPFHPGIELE